MFAARRHRPESALMHHASITSPDHERAYALLRETCGLMRLDDRRAIALRGEDRLAWLQGQATNDLRDLTAGASRAFCLVKPTGQIEAICQVWAFPDRLVLTTEAACAPAVLDRIARMVVIEDVTGEELPCDIWSAQGPAATRTLAGLVALPRLDAGEAELGGEPARLLRSDRTGMGGWDLLLSAGSRAAAVLQGRIEAIDPAVWRLAELEAGKPRFGVDAGAKTLPPELGPHFEDEHVSYAKGCYTGQEVLMRLRSRGHTNRTWRGLLAASPIDEGDRVAHPARADAGVVTSAGVSPVYGLIGAAMLRNEAAAPGDAVTVHTADGPVRAEVAAMPILRAR
jgi:folate-binding protein YgfZ